ncbi:MAG TPA: ribbon-helix-helix protein, CopG family [Bacteroidales bacterium]|nr:ribbon-helix-helix protein, CopG family [Bacteroidales bacterium]
MKKERFTFRLPKQLKEKIYKKAQSLGMSISEWVRYILQKEVEDD